MVTWQDNFEFYKHTSDVLDWYIKAHHENLKTDTTLNKLSKQMLEKIHTNLFTCNDLLPKVIDAHQMYLPYGLVLRGIVSDIINYLYLHQVNSDVGKESFEGEVKILDLKFVEAYEKLLTSDNIMHPKEAEEEEKIKEMLRNKFKDFYKNGKLVKPIDLRTDEMKDVVKKLYADKILKSAIESEAGKLQYIKLQNNTESLKVVYTYLSQLQHFSTYSYLHYSDEKSGFLNPHTSLFVAYVMNWVLILIVTDLSIDKSALESFGQTMILM